MCVCVCVCLGVNESYQMGLFQVLAAILHLGNVEVKDRDSDSSVIPVSPALLHNTGLRLVEPLRKEPIEAC